MENCAYLRKNPGYAPVPVLVFFYVVVVLLACSVYTNIS